MLEDAIEGISDKPLRSDVKDSSEEVVQKKPKKWYRREQWIYGFHLKNRHCRLIAEKHGLPWKKRPLTTTERVLDHITFVSRAVFRLRFVAHRDRRGMILFFAESDGRKRLKDAYASVEEMDKVRKAIGLPKGTKPKWYNCCGCDEYDNGADSSEDEARPVPKRRAPQRPPPPLVSESDEANAYSQDSDASMSSNGDDKGDNDETNSDDSSEDDTDNEQ